MANVVIIEPLELVLAVRMELAGDVTVYFENNCASRVAIRNTGLLLIPPTMAS